MSSEEEKHSRDETDTIQTDEHPSPSQIDEQFKALMKKRKRRSRALAIILAVIAILFYIVTFVKGPGILERPM